MVRAKSYKEYSTAFLYMFIPAFAEANRQKRIPNPVFLDANSLQYRHLHRNYTKIERYLGLVHYNGKNYSPDEKRLFWEFIQIDKRLKNNLGRQRRFPVKNLEDITL